MKLEKIYCTYLCKPLAETRQKDHTKCWFCGANKVDYRMIHPDDPLVLVILYYLGIYKSWIYCCDWCLHYMEHLGDKFEYEEIK